MFSPAQIFNFVSADFFSHSLTVRLKARHHINLFKYLDMTQVVSFFFFPVLSSSGRERGRGYVWAINIPKDFCERQLGNKRPYTSSWLIGSFINITKWCFYHLAFLDPLNDETVCVCVCLQGVCMRCHFASSLCDSLKADSSVCHLQEGRLQQSTERERKRKLSERERARDIHREGDEGEFADGQRQKVRMWGDWERLWNY